MSAVHAGTRRLSGVQHKVQRPRDRRPSAGRAMDLGSYHWLQSGPGSLPTPETSSHNGADAAAQLSPRTGSKARQGRRSIARPAPPDGRSGAYRQGTGVFRGASIKCQDPAMCAHPPDGRGTSWCAIGRRAVRAQCSYLTGSSGREIGWTSAYRTLKEQPPRATFPHPTEIDRMFAVGTARVFLETLSRWAFENEVCFPPEIREELKRFANENGRPFEEIRFMHFNRLHSFWPTERETMGRSRFELNKFFRPMLEERISALPAYGEIGAEGYRVRKPFGQRVLREVFESYSKTMSLEFEIAYFRGQNAMRVIKQVRDLSLEFHVFFRGGKEIPIWESLIIYQDEVQVGDARLSEIFGDDRPRLIFEEQDAEKHLCRLRGYIDQVCGFADAEFMNPARYQ